jgi:exosortase A-associated hydrolase 1
MDRPMRRLLTFQCEGSTLGATLDEAKGRTGLLLVTGGTQTRIGSHRMFERLAAALAASGYPCFRYDRRGVGDSEGGDPGWRGSAPDLEAAASAFRSEIKMLDRVIGFGLCDGGSTLALFGADAGLQGAILVNPWFVESETDSPPPAAIRHHYRKRLLSAEGWKKIATGSISYKKLFRGIGRIATARPSTLADEIADSLEGGGFPVALVLAAEDGTAIAAGSIWGSKRFEAIRTASAAPYRIESDSHTFARAGDDRALLQACQTALTALSRRG